MGEAWRQRSYAVLLSVVWDKIGKSWSAPPPRSKSSTLLLPHPQIDIIFHITLSPVVKPPIGEKLYRPHLPCPQNMEQKFDIEMKLKRTWSRIRIITSKLSCMNSTFCKTMHTDLNCRGCHSFIVLIYILD